MVWRLFSYYPYLVMGGRGVAQMAKTINGLPKIMFALSYLLGEKFVVGNK